MKKRVFSFLLAAVMLVGVLFTTSISAEESLYSDVEADRWSADDIAYVTEKGMMNGTDKGFEPTKAVNRAMVVTVLYRLAGSPTVYYSNTFSDVSKDEWYSEPVIWGAQNGIVTGFSDDTFRPLDPVTREQLVTFIGRYAELNYISVTGDNLEGFSDSDKIRDYAAEYFKWAVSVKLVKGVTDDELRPTAGATREQFAAIMHRFDTSEAFEYEIIYNTPVAYSQYTEREYPLQDDADLFVSPDGDDSNPGTKEKPLATMEGAKTAVRKLGKTGDVKVAFMAGVYKDTNVVFTSEDSGNGGTVTYCAYGDGDVEFNNGLSFDAEDLEELDEEDKKLFNSKCTDSIKKYDLSGLTNKENLIAAVLFNDEEMNYMARYPNRNTENDEDVYLHQTATYFGDTSIAVLPYVKSRFNKYHTWENVYVCGYLLFDYYREYATVTGYDPETGAISLKNLYYVVSQELDNLTFFVMNVSEELDCRGEYWIDTETETIYVYEPKGSYSLAYKTEAIIEVEEGTENLTFRGIDFRSNAGNKVFDTTDFPYLYPEVEKKFADNASIVTREGTKNITFDMCSFVNLANAYAIYLDGFNTHFTNNEVREVTGGGVYSNCADTAYYEKLVSAEKLIDNNYFAHNGNEYESYRHMLYSHDVGATISHNEFFESSHYALEMMCVETVAEYNIFTFCNDREDGGSIYTGQAATRVGNVIRYNMFISDYNGFEIYIDNGGSSFAVYGNLFFTEKDNSCTSLRMAGGRENYIYENVFINKTYSADSEWIPNVTATDINSKYYSMSLDGSVVSSTWTGFSYANVWPKTAEGTAIWQAKYPWLYEIDFDYENWQEKYEDPKHFVNANNCIFADNLIFTDLENGSEYGINDRVAELGRVENNLRISYDTNPLFVDPTHGDYRIRDDIDEGVVSSVPNIPFEKMGRY